MGSVPLPNFAKVMKKVLLLHSVRISDGEAKALKQFLVSSSKSSNAEFHIEKVVIADCVISDKGLSSIIEGIVQHRDHIRSLNCIKCEIGQQSINGILDLIPYLD